MYFDTPSFYFPNVSIYVLRKKDMPQNLLRISFRCIFLQGQLSSQHT